ncbi:MAG: HNH endonuclease signature motif containing protein [Nocardioides sp.]|uniref:HNH endonuclease signature motif containing protein n=1 Tax=Nocardioides sp. TaxID=35761 RepID=UPI0039E50B4B
MSQTVHQPPTPGSPDAVLASVRAARHAELAATARVLADAVEWAGMHEVPAGDGDVFSWCGNSIPLAGEGAPEIAEHAVAEFATVLGVSTDAGRALVGQALELAYRLPETWKGVQALSIPAWVGRRVADHTIALSQEAAGFVDRQVAAVAGKIGPVQLDRLITEARARFMAETLPADEYDCPDRRHVSIDADRVSFDGTVEIRAEVDLPDALDLDQALAVTAGQLKNLGSIESLDARRAAALGEIARNQLALTYPTDPTGRAEPTADALDEAQPVGTRAETPTRRPGRQSRPVTLFLHLSDEAVASAGGVGRCENTRTPISIEAIRDWCGNPDTVVTIRPVLDLEDHVHVEAYEVPDRLQAQVDQRDLTCVFPWCTRPARGCDHDHVIPHAGGGTTCSCNLAALCRRHHRLKTHTPWRYVMPEPGLYVWTSPHGYVFLRDHTGTTDVTPPSLTAIPGCQAPSDTDPPDQ